MLIAIVPLIFMVAGILIYALATNPKVVEIGRIMLFCGMFFVVMVTANQTVKLFGH